MRCANINKTPFSYKNNLGKTQVVDANGLKTGQYTLSYGDLTPAAGNISPAGGQALAEIFGLDTNYSRTIVMDDVKFPMKEASIVWIDAPTTGPHDYIVVKRAASINFVAYALKEVKAGA